MSKAAVSISTLPYKMDIQSGSGHYITGDEPIELGGGNLGFSPDELLCAALASCTSATLRMYADRKQWPLEGVEVEVSIERMPGGKETNFVEKINLKGNINAEQRERLMDIAGKCPVHKTLTNQINIQTI